MRIIFLKLLPFTNSDLDLDLIGSWNSVRINLGFGLRGLDIRPGLDNRHLIIEGHRGLRR